MIIRELLNLLGLEVQEGEFQKGEKAIVALEKALAVVATVGAGAALVINKLVDDVQTISRSAATLGVGAGALQEWGYAAQATGSDLRQLTQTLLGLQTKVHEVATGNKDTQKLFRQLGLSVRTAGGELKSMETLLPEVADAFARMENGTKKTALATELLGGLGAKTLLPMFTEGSAGLREFAAEARAMGAVLNEQAIGATKAFDDELTRARAILLGLTYDVGLALLPAVRDILTAVRAWVKENRAFIATGFGGVMRLLSAAARITVQAFEPLLRLFRWLVEDTALVKLGFYALIAVMLVYAGTAAQQAAGATLKFISLLRALTVAQARAAVVGAATPYAIAAAWGALVAILGLLLEDVYMFFTGGESLIGRWAQWILKALTIDEGDSSLVKFLKFLGLLIFDFVGAMELAGDAIARAWDAIVGAISGAITSLKDTISGFFSWLFARIKDAGRGWSALLRGDLVQAASAFLDAWGPVGNAIGGTQFGVSGQTGELFTLNKLLGRSASPAATLASSAAAAVSNSSASVVNAPSQVVNNTINVGATASPVEVAEKVGKATEGAWERQVRDSQFAVQGG